MKTIFQNLVVTFALFIAITTNAQQTNVGIGTNTPAASAKLDVSSTTQGLLIPRMTMAQRNAISSPATGLQIYQIDNTPGFYFYNGSAWAAIGGGAGWSLAGNTGTNEINNFIGTTDNSGIVFKTNNTTRWQISRMGRLLNSSALGTNSLFIGGGNETTTGANNTQVGASSMLSNTTGNFNSAFGESALLQNTTGFRNTAIGASALLANTVGGANVAVGFSAMQANTTGDLNVALGQNALISNTTGSSNTAVGFGANVSANNLTNATAIGNAAIVDASNKIRLGNNSVNATDIAGQVKVNAQSTTTSFTLPASRGIANQVLQTDGAGSTQWVTPSAPVSTYPNVELSVATTSIQNIPQLSSTAEIGSTVLAFSTTNHAQASLTGGNTWDGSVFTVGSTGAGWYQINAQAVGVSTTGGLSTVPINFFMDKNNTGATQTPAATTYQSTHNVLNSLGAVMRQAQQFNTFIYLAAGDNIRLRAISGSNSVGANTSGDGRTYLNIVRIK